MPRGWLTPQEQTRPVLSNGKPATAICLIGHAGGGFWPVFEAWRQSHAGIADPLDAWSKAVIRPVAARLRGEAVFPSDAPWHPFQQWATAAEGLRPSPLGLLIDPVYGLWHGYRGAILFDVEALTRLALEDPAVRTDGSPKAQSHPCDGCPDRPCLSGCPVGAFGSESFAVAECRSHLESDAGRHGCMNSGCSARDACPVGREHRYSPAQIRFHMAALLPD